MITNDPLVNGVVHTDDVGRALARRLDAVELRPDLAQRLRAAREQAVDLRRTAWALSQYRQLAAAGAYGSSQDVDSQHIGLWAAMLLLVLMLGLGFLQDLQSDRVAGELAVVDHVLLTDDLPPQAYLDPGFRAFLKLSFPDEP
ncbi:MAG: hypothetical protein OHK0048_16540 [Rhodoferax sp.]